MSRERPEQSRRLSGALSVAAGLLFLAAAAWAGIAALGNTVAMAQKVERTGDLVKANIRTLTQTQRELMKLELLMVADSRDVREITQQQALVTSRMNESSLSYQRFTLGSQHLLRRARADEAVWRNEVVPLVNGWKHRRPGWQGDREQAIDRIRALELDVNDIVSQGEANRQQTSFEANATARSLVARMRLLAYAVLATLLISVVLTLVGGHLIRRLLRDRATANARLRTVNSELEEAADVLRATNTMLVLTDLDGRLTWANEAFTERTGWRVEDMLGQISAVVMAGPDTSPAFTDHLSRAMRDAEPISGEVALYTAAGERLWVGLLGSPVRSGEQVTGYVWVFSDLTEREEAHVLLEHARQAAERTAREKSAFLATMSHEIRTPLNAVLGLIDLLRFTELNAEQREYAETAARSGKHLFALLNDILDFSALESGTITLEARPFTLEEAVRSASSILAPTAQRAGLDLVTEVDPRLPVVVVGDEVRLRQILLNLISNAVKFTESGSVDVRAEPGETQPDDPPGTVRVRFRVEDTGIGIDPEEAPDLFLPFRQGDTSTTRRFGGTGLGLTICRQLAVAMGGSIEIAAPAEHRGTVVTVVLPFAATAPTPGVPSSAARDAPHDASDLRVLVAEDDPVNRTVVLHMLRRFGIEPTFVEDGLAAVQAVAEHTYDVVLLDLQMPVMDGLAAAAGIRELGGTTPYLVAVTADASPEARERIGATGFDDYLGKPISLQRVEDLLVRVPGAGRVSLR